MNSRQYFLFLLALTLLLIACRGYYPTSSPIPTARETVTIISNKPTSTPLSTQTPLPSSTSTLLPSSPSPTTISTHISTSTPISPEVQLRLFESIWTIVNDTYVYPDFNGLDWDAIHREYRQIISAGLTNDEYYLVISELIDRLGDDHSYFLDPQQAVEQDAEYQGEHDYVGIGIMVSAVPERERAVILSVFPDSPAEEAGLQPRDSLISVDGIPILDEDGFLRDIVRGPEGTSIHTVVQTPGEQPRELYLTRHRITGSYPVLYDLITTPEGKRIGYILLVTFMDSTVDAQVAAAIREMSASAPLDGLILDDHMNDGGSSLVFEPILGFFEGGHLGYYIQHSEEYPLKVKLNDINDSANLPLVVLVGSRTASFGEIFAGVLQDTDRAYLIGTTTDGNVEVLWGYDFEDGSQLWLANETFRPLNHPEQNWEKTGIIPDLSIAGEFDQYRLENDPAVMAAIQYLVKQ